MPQPVQPMMKVSVDDISLPEWVTQSDRVDKGHSLTLAVLMTDDGILIGEDAVQ